MSKRFFNTAGPCRPELHYTVDPLPRLPEVRNLIDSQNYFVLHAPRQTGKTTFLYAMMHQLNSEGRYTALQVNIQPAASGRDPEHAMQIAATCIYAQAERFLPPAEMPPDYRIFDWQLENGLKAYLAQWSKTCPKPIVFFVDEADSLMDDLFLTLLRQLRAGFEARPDTFPQSIGLIGLRDVRDYKIRLRPGSNSMGTGSPFNIKTESLFMDVFTEAEVNTLMDLHQQETGQVFSPEVRAEVYRLSQGQPWLTNALLNQVVAAILKNDFSRTISISHITQAREELIRRRDTHLDSLVDKLHEDRVRAIITAIMAGTIFESDRFNDDLAYVQDLGLITHKPPIRFANPIYQEIIPRVLCYGMQVSIPEDYVENKSWYISNGKLSMDALLTEFQKFYREHSEVWLGKFDFREVGRQLLLMAFLQRVINGGGRVEREMAVGKGRSDLIVYFGSERFVLELKLRYRPVDEERGLAQLADYLDTLREKHGYLILFEIDAAKSWEKRIRWEQRQQDGKEITLVGL
jgi:hypothetical protein